MAQISWPKQEAEKILKAHSSLDQEILFETGFGPSGLPHLGTFAEVARTLFVVEAVKQLEPKAKTRLLVFCDDLDGLRAVPENLPQAELLSKHLGEPLSGIPDPFGEESSFSAYMNGQLRKFLDGFGFDYEYRSSTACYQSGEFDSGLKAVMDHYDAIRDLFIQTIASEKRAAWSPFFVICEQCGKIYSARVTEVDRANYEVAYHCDLDGKGFQACGYQGKSSILGGRAKVGWKVDWALRWFVFGVDYEMYGKDLMESAGLSAKICRVLGGKAPTPYKYELFLDETGAKISKKIGNGINMEQWMRFAPLGALLSFLLGNPNKAKKMGMPILPRLIDEYMQVARSEASAEPFCAAWFIAKTRRQPLREAPEIRSEVSFGLLYNVAESLNLNDAGLLFDYARKYDPRVEEDVEFYREITAKVVSLVEDAALRAGSFEFRPDPAFVPLFRELVAFLEAQPETMEGDQVQTKIFSLAKEAGRNPREFFAFLYGALLGKDQGPKLGPFFAILGQEAALAKCRVALAKLEV